MNTLRESKLKLNLLISTLYTIILLLITLSLVFIVYKLTLREHRRHYLYLNTKLLNPDFPCSKKTLYKSMGIKHLNTTFINPLLLYILSCVKHTGHKRRKQSLRVFNLFFPKHKQKT